MIQLSLGSITGLRSSEMDAIISMHTQFTEIGLRVRNIILIGSKARGDFRPDSDIDMVVVLRNAFEDAETEAKVDNVIRTLSDSIGLELSAMIIDRDSYDDEAYPPAYDWIPHAIEQDGIEFLSAFKFIEHV